MPSVQQRVYHELRARLRDCTIKPDTRLNIADTAEELDASIIPTREAFARLAAEGLLERVAAGGFKAPGLSLANVEGDFTVVFLFLRHITDLRFEHNDLAATIIGHVGAMNAALPELRGEPLEIAREAELYVRGLLPFTKSAKLRSCVEAALDTSTIYRRVYYRETFNFDIYLSVRLGYEKALRDEDPATAYDLVRFSQRDWEGKTRQMCRFAWTELFEG